MPDGIDVVIANAGVSVGTLTEHAEDLDVFARDRHQRHGHRRHLCPLHRRHESQGSGRLVGIGSVAGIRGLPGAEAYSASKAAVISYCESLRLELPAGMKVVTICPGYIDTPMTRHNAYRMPFLMPAEKFAARAARAIADGAATA
jgi:NAD(P)-dependent dehydrogenase (short-subunit alcohol dehydrogenase family)